MKNSDSEPVIINMPRIHHLPNSDDIETQTNDNSIKKDVYDNVIYNYIKEEIKELLIWEKYWKTIGLFFTILKYMCLVAVPILSLSSPYFKNQSETFAYLSGALSSLALGFERLSKLSQNISKSKKDKTNILLEQIGVNYQIKEVDVATENNSADNILSPKYTKK